VALLVKKFGGTSLGSIERIQAVAIQIKTAVSAGDKVVVVVSAMSGQTNALNSLAVQISDTPSSRELDALLATGEQQSAALLAIALTEIGCTARSFGAAQLEMRGDGKHARARLVSVVNTKIIKSLESGIVPIITGFQAVGASGQWLTLGRGGSDTTAVAIAASLQADECQIYTDVAGVYSADPRIVQSAKLLKSISLCALSYMASSGAKVVQRRAIECAYKYKINLRVLSSFEPGAGTYISSEDSMEKGQISGVSFEREQAYVELRLSGKSGVHAMNTLMGAFAKTGVHIDCLRNDFYESGVDCSFVIASGLKNELNNVISYCQNETIVVELRAYAGVARLAVVGVGVGSRPEIASEILATLYANGIALNNLLTDEHRYTLLLAEDAVESAARCLHEQLVDNQLVME
jgi:aspartate kinase